MAQQGIQTSTCELEWSHNVMDRQGQENVMIDLQEREVNDIIDVVSCHAQN